VKFYRHYKDKPYRYLGVAKHSESLEDVVVYECLYPNDLAILWVRPRKMFEEMVNGRPRFEKIEPRLEFISTTTGGGSSVEALKVARERNLSVSEEHFVHLANLNPLIFPDWNEAEFRKNISEKSDVMLLLAWIDGQVAGYKLGYRSAANPEVFSSMLGGVVPKFRGVGLGEHLMREQHLWASREGYKCVRTNTMNEHRAQLALNIKFGFNIISCATDSKDGRFKILMEKSL
jgi:ribosomal protein S18 acetylase RimI-like enzyme